MATSTAIGRKTLNLNEKTGQSSKLRSAATVTFENQDQEESNTDKPQKGGDEEEEEEEEEECAGEEDIMLSIMKEFQKRSKMASIRSGALQNQKNALFSTARKNAKELVRATNLHIDEALAKIIEMKSHEVPYQKCFEDAMPLWEAHDEAVGSLLAVYPLLIDGLFSRRVEAINAASSMLENNPIEREKARKRFMKDAYAQLNQSLENERVATDATALIKHYKALMLS